MSHYSSALPDLTGPEVPAFAGTQDSAGTAPDATDERILFTRPRQVAFLAALAGTGSVRSAAATAGISHQTA